MTDGPQIVGLGEIVAALGKIDALAEMERGFVEYSAGRCVVPPVGELLFQDPPGDVHIKYGYVQGDELYVVKIASGFYENPARGLPSSDGLMLLFRQATGEPVAVLLDGGHLTNVRTAAAGAVAARHLAPRRIERIGVLGTGTQARLQLRALGGVTACRRVSAWDLEPELVEAFCEDLALHGFEVEPATEPAAVAARAQLIVTATPATEPLLSAGDLRPGTHVTAVGSDTPEKQELDAALVASADRLVADSLEQCRARGEISHALRAGLVREGDLVELGAVIDGRAPGRPSEEAVTIVDLTGVAVQDLRIASAVYGVLR